MLHCQFLCHVLKALFFIEIAQKLSYICKKMQNFRALGALPLDPRASGGWRFCPRPQNTPPLRISSYAPGRGYSVLLNYESLVSILFPLAPLQSFFSIKYR